MISKFNTLPAWPLTRIAGTLALVGLLGSALTGCGGGSGGGNAGLLATPAPSAAAPSSSSAAPTPSTPLAKRTLLIDLDGVTYEAVRQGIASGQLPNLARLQPQIAYGGGVLNDVSQQPNLDAPGWTTLLTGTWASRHRIFSIVPGQKPAVPTLFERVKDAGTNLTGAAVASLPLAVLLASDGAAGALDTLADCSQDAAADDCVTHNALQMIGNGKYATIVAQFHSAEDVALNNGLGSANYAQTLAQLDAAVGTLVSGTARNADSQWMVVVTSSHGLNANGRADGLPQVPQSATFVATNQSENNGQQGATPALPATVGGLYGYASIADLMPTLLAYLEKTPANEQYAMDGGQLVGAQPPAQLAIAVLENNTTRARATISWSAPADAPVVVLRDGSEIARLPAGTTSYTDALASNPADLQTGKYQFSYTVVAGTSARAVLTPQISYIKALPPVPLAATLLNGLTVYYPFGNDPQVTAPVDAMSNSTLKPWAADANGGAKTLDPLGGSGLFIDTNIANSAGYDGYVLAPQPSKDVVNSAIAGAGAFSVGFWYKAPACSTNTVGEPIFSNKTGYATSGGTAGIIISMFGCALDFNVADGANRVDTNNPYIPFSENQWVYLSMVVDVGARTMTAYVFDPVLGNVSKTTAIPAGLNIAGLAGVNTASEIGFGLGEDGTGKFYMKKNGQTAGSYDPSRNATDKAMQMAFSDLAMWNRALTSAELGSVYFSQKPLSSLQTP